MMKTKKNNMKSNEKKRPYIMKNINFPPARYGLILSIVVIGIFLLIELFNFFQ